jgi:hypothetical protein
VNVPPHKVFLGFDANEMRAHNVAQTSLFRYASRREVLVERICIGGRLLRLYQRPTEERNGRLWDVISDAPMSTEHAIARFFVPFLCDYQGWAVFTDGDVLFRDDVRKLFALADERYAVMVVQHPPLLEQGLKKDGAQQVPYPRKNWSSVMLLNCGHESNRHLTLDLLHAWPGRDLHAFRWLMNAEIGALPARWNHLVTLSEPDDDPAVVHFTLGTPDLEGHEHDPFADEWYDAARMAGYKLQRPSKVA